MNELSISITEAARNFSDCVNRVAYRGEHFVLVRGKKAVAELKPAVKGRRMKDLASVFRTVPPLSKAEAEAFRKDLDNHRDDR